MTRVAVGIIIELNRQITELEAELAAHFEAPPGPDIYLSLPGLGVILGARVLGEFGDDPNRYTTAPVRTLLAHALNLPAMLEKTLLGRNRPPRLSLVGHTKSRVLREIPMADQGGRQAHSWQLDRTSPKPPQTPLSPRMIP